LRDAVVGEVGRVVASSRGSAGAPDRRTCEVRYPARVGAAPRRARRRLWSLGRRPQHRGDYRASDRRRAEIRGIEEDQVAADDGDGQKEEGKTAVQEISAS